MTCFLGIDIGTSGAKVLLIDVEGRKLASHTSEYPLSTPRPLWSEQDPEYWWAATVEGVRSVLVQTGIAPGDVAAIGLSGQMHGSVFLDSHGDVIRPAILWNDQRTQAQCDWITSQVGHENLVRLIANPVLTGFTAPKIVWLRDNEPENYARVARVLLPKDYVRYRLTGVHATEVSDASGTALFDVPNRVWSGAVLDAIDIPRSWMPDCAESQDITGYVSHDASVVTGLCERTPVAGGGGDQAAGAVGCGIVETGVVSSSIGTSGVVFAFSDQPAIDPLLRIHTFCHAVPGKWHVMGVHLSSGGSLRWLRDTFFGGMSYDKLTELASEAPPGSEGLIYLPYLTGERTPYPDPYARGVFFGATLRSNRAHFVRSVLEGVSYSLRDTFEIFKEIGVEISQVRTSGGGAKSSLWRQINADITGNEHVTLTVDEGPGLGAAILAAVGVGAYDSVPDACKAIVKLQDFVEPNGEANLMYNRLYPVYKSLYPANKPIFASLARAVE